MPSAPRRTREIKWTRSDILDAAERAFAITGFEATTMQEIAQESGFTVPSIYAYFQGKQELFDELNERLENEIEAVFERALPKGLAFEQKLELVVTNMLELIERRKCAITVFMQAKHGKKRICGFEHAAARWEKWLRRESEKGDLGMRDNEEAATALFGIVNAFFVRWMARGDSEIGPALSSRAKTIVDMFTHGLGGSAKRR